MKKVLKPASKEDAVFYSDFSGKVFDECGPHCEIEIKFNYGSKFDGGALTLYLTDEEADEMLKMIKPKLSTYTKDEYKHLINQCKQAYQDSVTQRNMQLSEELHNSIDVLQYMIKDS